MQQIRAAWEWCPRVKNLSPKLGAHNWFIADYSTYLYLYVNTDDDKKATTFQQEWYITSDYFFSGQFIDSAYSVYRGYYNSSLNQFDNYKDGSNGDTARAFRTNQLFIVLKK